MSRPLLPFLALAVAGGLGCGPEASYLRDCKTSGPCRFQGRVGNGMATDLDGTQVRVKGGEGLQAGQKYDINGRLDLPKRLLTIGDYAPVVEFPWVPVGLALAVLVGAGVAALAFGDRIRRWLKARRLEEFGAAAREEAERQEAARKAARLQLTNLGGGAKVDVANLRVPGASREIVVDFGAAKAPVSLSIGHDPDQVERCREIDADVTVYQIAREGREPPGAVLANGLTVHVQLTLEDPTSSLSRQGHVAVLVDESGRAYVLQAQDAVAVAPLVRGKGVETIASTLMPLRIEPGDRVEVLKVGLVYRAGPKA